MVKAVDRVWVEFHRAFGFRERFVVSPKDEQEVSIPMMGIRILRVETDCSLEFLLRPFPVPLIKRTGVAKGRMGFSEQRIHFQGHAGELDRFGRMRTR